MNRRARKKAKQKAKLAATPPKPAGEPAQTAKSIEPPPAPPAGTFSNERLEQIETLARLGFTMTPANIEVILDLKDGELSAWIQTDDGARRWKKWRTEARAELMQVVQQQALAGDHAAQKVLAELYERDDVARTADLRLPASEVYELLDRSARKIRERVNDGDMIDVGPDHKYALRGLLGLIPALWAKLAVCRQKVAHLEKLTDKSHVDESEARRQAILEVARARKMANDAAEGKLIDAAAVNDQFAELCRIVREQSANLVEDLALKLSVSKAADQKLMADARATFLKRCADAMTQTQGGSAVE